MPRTPDRDDGIRLEEEIEFEDRSPDLAPSERRVRYANGRFSMFDALGEFNPRDGLTSRMWERVVSQDLIVPSFFTYPIHDFTLTNGNSIFVEQDAVLLVL